MPNTEPQSLKSAHRQRINKAASIASIILGLFVALIGILLGFVLMGGKILDLWVPPEIVIVLGLVVGGLSISFEPLRSIRMLLDSVYVNDGGATERLRTNIEICECGAKLSVFAGIVATLLGSVVTFGHLGIDVQQVGQYIAHSLKGMIVGMTMSVVVFLPLKYLFRRRASEETNATVKS